MPARLCVTCDALNDALNAMASTVDVVNSVLVNKSTVFLSRTRPVGKGRCFGKGYTAQLILKAVIWKINAEY